MPVVVVESPAKAKTIRKYLGSNYDVVASFGHVRDLSESDGSVEIENGFAMKWNIPAKSREHISNIANALKKADGELILATDPDREGEAISWHVREVLKKRRGLKLNGETRRVVFNAVTKSAVQEAMEQPRGMDMALVEAYLARRALDYLVGYKLSPVLWRKLPGARSAGRVQSVCVRLIVEREAEIEAFKEREYWTVDAELSNSRKEEFVARLTKLGGKKLAKFSLPDKESAERAMGEIKARELSVATIESKLKTRSPSPPFVTATLQQEASRKFGFNPRRTMSAAQKLYEAGRITYMRTDGIDMAPEAVTAVREEIGKRFGSNYLPKSARKYKNKAKNVQEAHECIRPTSVDIDPKSFQSTDEDQGRLYSLIWNRTVASQMQSAKFLNTVAEIESSDGYIGLRATGRVAVFDGFLRIYEEGTDDKDAEDSKELPSLKQGEALEQRKLIPKQHFTTPPPRYTEAALIKKMVELGIGRPSTYSSIVTTIQDRGYVRQEKKRLVPEAIGRLVSVFLCNYFGQYVDYGFTAGLEAELDGIANSRTTRLDVLTGFWKEFAEHISETMELENSAISAELSEMLAPVYFPTDGNNGSSRTCPECRMGLLTLKTFRKSKPFFACSRYPDCHFNATMTTGKDSIMNDRPSTTDLGFGPDGLPVTLRTGRYGPYLQLGSAQDGNPPPKRVSVPQEFDLASIDLEIALKFLALPRDLGKHLDGQEIQANIGRYGPYVRQGNTYANVPASEILTIGMNRAMELLAQKRSRGSGRASRRAVRDLGPHPREEGDVQVFDGRYGPYVSWNKINATIPKDVNPAEISLLQAVALIDQKRAGGGGPSVKPIKELGEHPSDGGIVVVLDGRYGPYIKWNRINATIPKNVDPESITMVDALKLIESKRGG